MSKFKTGIFDVKDIDLPDLSSGGLKSQEATKLTVIRTELERLKEIIQEKDDEINHMKSETELSNESSYKKGFNEGYERAKQDVSESFEIQFNDNITQLAENISFLIEDLSRSKKSIILNSEESIINLIFLIVEKIIHKEISIDKKIIDFNI